MWYAVSLFDIDENLHIYFSLTTRSFIYLFSPVYMWFIYKFHHLTVGWSLLWLFTWSVRQSSLNSSTNNTHAKEDVMLYIHLKSTIQHFNFIWLVQHFIRCSGVKTTINHSSETYGSVLLTHVYLHEHTHPIRTILLISAHNASRKMHYFKISLDRTSVGFLLQLLKGKFY